MKGTRDFSPVSTQIPGAVFIDDDSGPPKSKSALKKARKKQREKLEKEMKKLGISQKPENEKTNQNPPSANKTNYKSQLEVSKESKSNRGISSTNDNNTNDTNTWQTVSKSKSVHKSESAKLQNGKNVVVSLAVTASGAKSGKNRNEENAAVTPEPEIDQDASDEIKKIIRRLRKKLTQIERLEERKAKGEQLTDSEIVKLASKDSIIAELYDYE